MPVTRNLWHLSLLLIPAFALIQIFTYYVVPDTLVNLTTERLAEAVNSEIPSARLHIWYDSLRLFLQSPWMGIGTGAIKSQSFQLLDHPTAYASGYIFEHAHNLFLHLLTEMGIGALLIVSASVIAWIGGFKWRELGIETWWGISILAVLGIHSMLEYPLWFSYFLGIAALLSGAGDEHILKLRLNSKFVQITIGLILLLGTLNLGTLFFANMKLENALQQSTEPEKQKQTLDWISNYSLLRPYADIMSAISMVVDRGSVDKQILLNTSAMRFMPLRKIAYQQVLLLQLRGDHIEAKNLLKRTLAVYPSNLKYVIESIPKEYRKDFTGLLFEVNPALLNEIALD